MKLNFRGELEDEVDITTPGLFHIFHYQLQRPGNL
jgi:hypothetical protein